MLRPEIHLVFRSNFDMNSFSVQTVFYNSRSVADTVQCLCPFSALLVSEAAHTYPTTNFTKFENAKNFDQYSVHIFQYDTCIFPWGNQIAIVYRQ